MVHSVEMTQKQLITNYDFKNNKTNNNIFFLFSKLQANTEFLKRP